MLKKYFIFLTLLSFNNCGFQVVYKANNIEIPYQQELAAIVIKKDRTKTNQELKNYLYDWLNPEYLKVEPKYFLTLSSQPTYSSTFTTATGSSGRNAVILSVSYVLQDIKTGETISTGSVSTNDNYDVTTRRYGTIVADEYTKSNLTKVAAQNIRNSLINDLIQAKKKADCPPEDEYN